MSPLYSCPLWQMASWRYSAACCQRLLQCLHDRLLPIVNQPASCSPSSGLERQLALCDSASAPSWCSDTQLLSQLRTALDRLWSTIVNNADVAFSEVAVVTKACL